MEILGRIHLGLIFCKAWYGYKLFANSISKQQDVIGRVLGGSQKQLTEADHKSL